MGAWTFCLQSWSLKNLLEAAMTTLWMLMWWSSQMMSRSRRLVCVLSCCSCSQRTRLWTMMHRALWTNHRLQHLLRNWNWRLYAFFFSLTPLLVLTISSLQNCLRQRRGPQLPTLGGAWKSGELNETLSKYECCKLYFNASKFGIVTWHFISIVAFCHWGNIYGGRQSHTENIYPSSEAIIRGLLTINSGHVKEGEGKQGDNGNAQLRVRGRSDDGQVVRGRSGEGKVKVRWATSKLILLRSELYVNAPYISKQWSPPSKHTCRAINIKILYPNSGVNEMA